jgi:hypothetical protein
MSSKYSNGKIYKLKCSDGKYYYGSTISSLQRRLFDHKSCAKKNPNRKIYNHINTLGWENVNIELIEDFPCSSIRELHNREDYYINNVLKQDYNNCLNINRVDITDEENKQRQKQYNMKNREKIADYKAFYRVENANKIREYNKQYSEEHKEEILQKKRKYHKENAEKEKEQMKQYYEKNKDTVNAYKIEWQRQKRASQREANKAERDRPHKVGSLSGAACGTCDAKAAEQETKTAARLAAEREIQTCACGGTYQNYRKSRDMESLINPYSSQFLKDLSRAFSSESDSRRCSRRQTRQAFWRCATDYFLF